MITLKWMAVVGLLALATGIAWAGCCGEDNGRAAGSQTSVPAWAAVAEQSISPVDARVLKNAAHRFYGLLMNGKKDAAYLLLAPETVQVVGASFDPKHRQIVSIDSIGEPQVESVHWARVETAVTWKELTPGPDQGKSSSQPDVLYFRLCDPKHLIRFEGAGGPTMYELPATAASVPPWWAQPNRKPADPNWPEMVAQTDAAFSRHWSGWSQDPQKLWSNIQGWWADQSKAYGTYAGAADAPQFVAMSGDGAVVEVSDIFSAGADGGTRATYRYRLVQDATGNDPPVVKEHLQWRIADICLVNVEKLTAEQVTALVGTAGSGGGCGCGCGSGGGVAPAPAPEPKPAEQQGGGCGCSDMNMKPVK